MIIKLSKAVGFEVLELKSVPFKVYETVYSATDSDFAEIRYYGNDSMDDISFRKSVGQEENSGNYSEYLEIKEKEINQAFVTMKGNDGFIYLVYWTDGDYAYSISSASGYTEAVMTELVLEAMGE